MIIGKLGFEQERKKKFPGKPSATITEKGVKQEIWVQGLNQIRELKITLLHRKSP